MSEPAQSRLRELRQQVRAQLDGLNAADSRRQFHPDLSPMAWHVGHSFFTEAYWVQEVVCADNTHTTAWHPLYFPEYSHKQQRGRQLPAPTELIAWTQQLEARMPAYWQRAGNTQHALMRNHYLHCFIAQHYAQHLETMAMVRLQTSLAAPPSTPVPARLDARPCTPQFVAVTGGEIEIGGHDAPGCYDNEMPTQRLQVAAFGLADAPVTNGEWLMFMQDGGYARAEFWDERGRAWLQQTGARHPQHWRACAGGGWYCPDPRESLASTDPVHGICWHEAMAFARWAGARLPHEYEWEFGARRGLLAGDGEVWEWCNNALHPYPGFNAFPYDGYSKPWFDGLHRIARGASRHTCAEIRRPSFRNFYPETHRHVFAGLRLATN